jgi:hypothetical protein
MTVGRRMILSVVKNILAADPPARVPHHLRHHPDVDVYIARGLVDSVNPTTSKPKKV